LVLAGAASVYGFIVDLHRAAVVGDFIDGNRDLNRIRAADHAFRVSGVMGLIALALTAVLFLTWLYQLSKDLHERRPGHVRYSPGWAVGGWFVPFLSLVRPFQVVRDLWRSSELSGWRSEPAQLVGWWWGLFLLSNFTSLIAASQPTDTLEQFRTHDHVYAVSDVIDVIATIVAIQLVRALTRRVDALPASISVPVGQYGMTFNPAPGWPAPPAGWAPPPGWQPDPTWPPAPPNWRFWLPIDG
jgi:hypothetical protein